MIYVASPYTHEDEKVQTHRALVVLAYTVERMRQDSGTFFFSPIVYGHTIRQYDKSIAGTADFWRTFNWKIICACSAVEVLMLDGWAESKGISIEVDWAKQLKLPINYVAVS